MKTIKVKFDKDPCEECRKINKGRPCKWYIKDFTEITCKYSLGPREIPDFRK